MSQQSSVSISGASNILGVSEAALRQWTDDGKLKAFITPGGHRRFSRVELKKFMASRQKVHGIKDLVSELEGAVGLLRETGRLYLDSTSWYNQIDQEHQKHLAGLGRRLLDLIIRYIAEPSKREESSKLARDAGAGLGETLAELGLPLTDAVEAFLLHRNPIMNAATHLVRKREAFDKRVGEAIPLVDHLMDEALLALVAAHQHYRDESRGKTAGVAAE